MKVYINKPKNCWLSPYTVIKWLRFGREFDYHSPRVEWWVKRLAPVCELLQKVCTVIRPSIAYVKIDHWDTWSLDYTLAHIILPALKQLRDNDVGAPHVDDDDVPLEIRSSSAPEKENEWDTDEFHFERWKYVLGEMIFAFECKRNDTEIEFYNSEMQERQRKGFALFGKYYNCLWI